ncbi:procathepsin L-like [Ylistrum balloti]|uniref:procathepsin L-like n=1 Tax=Ylistrum balloti TaxID=509963 RepID=UPI002905859E|nr:procathepsin L-like [Ylistrum balloti]
MLLFLCFLLPIVSALPNVREWYQLSQAQQDVPTDLSPYDVKFLEFQRKYNKVYPTVQEEFRKFEIFKTNIKIIEEHNKLYVSGLKKFFLGASQFTDMDSEEFSKWVGMSFMRKSNPSMTSTFLRPNNVVYPGEVDWRKEGYGSQKPVKDKGACESCWAFSATGALEGQYFKKTKSLASLSQQQLVDCSTSFGDEGCNGGLMVNAFKYVETNGIESEFDYPYTAKVSSTFTRRDCKYNASKVIVTCTGIIEIPFGSELDLLAAVATVGPISVSIDASHISFQLYAGDFGHAVLAVVYDKLNGSQMWIVKNSWGTHWGVDGYVMMSRNKTNQCGIATMASYPLW